MKRDDRLQPPVDPDLVVTMHVKEVDDPSRLDRLLAILNRMLDTPSTPDEGLQR